MFTKYKDSKMNKGGTAIMAMQDKRDIVRIFRERLHILIGRSGLSYSQFARFSGLDRSTLSQLLAEERTRLPRMETIYHIAFANKISTDWLLGLSQNSQVTADILMEIETSDSRGETPSLERWREEVRESKIRYVPSTLPDMLKTEDILEWEFRSHLKGIKEKRSRDMTQSLVYNRRADTDMEVCFPFQSLHSFAYGDGIWNALDKSARIEQLDHMARLLEEMYPTFRCFLYDGLTQHSTSYTVFGYKRAAIYIGGMYFVFTSTSHIKILSSHFDMLIRHAEVQPHHCADYVRLLRIR